MLSGRLRIVPRIASTARLGSPARGIGVPRFHGSTVGVSATASAGTGAGTGTNYGQIRSLILVAGNRNPASELIGKVSCKNPNPNSRQDRTFQHTNSLSRAVKSSFEDLDIPEVPITEFAFQNFKRFGDRPAFIDALTGRQYTFPQLRDAIWRVASGLTRHGVRQNDVVMVISENCLEYPVSVHAALTIGGTVTLANPQNTTGEIRKQALDSGTKFIMTSRKFSSKAIELKDTLKNEIKKVFVFGEESGCVPFSELLGDDGTLCSEHVSVDLRRHTCLLPYSSGTTGLPKGVMISHRAEVANSMQTDSPIILPDREGAVLVGVLPFYHIYAFVAHIVNSVAQGQTTVIQPGFDPKLFLESIQEYRVNLAFVVPPIVLFLNKHPMVDAADLASLTRVLSAAAPLGKELVEEFHSKRHGCSLSQGYGMTETGPTVCINPVWDCVSKPASSGTPVANTEVKVVDFEDRSKECELGQKGELCTRGPQMMLGYLNNPQATADTIDADGWLHTGDVAYLDNDKHIYICDRIKELIKFKGIQVPPAELEALLSTHPAVADAAVIGIPDQEAGEIPKAFVALRHGAVAKEKEIQQFVEERVPSYKKLRGGVKIVAQIPRSPAGKILRGQLRQC